MKTGAEGFQPVGAGVRQSGLPEHRACLDGGLWPALLPDANSNRQPPRIAERALVISGAKYWISEKGVGVNELLDGPRSSRSVGGMHVRVALAYLSTEGVPDLLLGGGVVHPEHGIRVDVFSSHVRCASPLPELFNAGPWSIDQGPAVVAVA